MKRLIEAGCLILLLTTGALAQVTGTIAGTVSDQTGAVIPGVEVTATHAGTGLSRSVVTNDRGGYTIPSLPTGEYNLKALLPGFQTALRQGVVLQVDDRLTVNIQLQLGDVNQTILVTEAAPLIQSETSSIGSVIENRRIVELPLNSRQFQSLTMLVPGAQPSAEGSSRAFRGGIVVAGTRDSMTSFTLDGVDIVGTQQQVTSFNPSIDMIQEFKIQTSTYPAEYGRKAGGMVTVTTKSGTNDLHGTMFHFLRNHAMDAKNLFDPANEPIPEFRRNNFGASLGGPIVRNRTFFFFNYEGLILKQSITRTSAVPTPAMVKGNFSSLATPIRDPLTGLPFPGNIIPANRIHPIGQTMANQYPAPNLPGTVRNFVASPLLTQDIHQFTTRIDNQFSTNNNFHVRYTFNDSMLIDPYNFGSISNLPDYGRTDYERAMSIAVADTHVFSPSLVGELRLGHNRYTQIRANIILDDIPAQWGIIGTTKSPNPLDHGVPAVLVTGFETIGKTNLPSDRTDVIHQIIGSLTYTNGGHTMKLGGDITRMGSMRMNNGGGRGTFRFTGEYTGNGLADLLLGYPRQTSRDLGDSRNPMWAEYFSLYFQDDWKATSRLTLNLGVRYDLNTPNRSTMDRLVRFNPDTRALEIAGSPSTRRDIGRLDNPLSPHYRPELAVLAAQVRMVDVGRRNIHRFDRNDIAPRVGLAYRVADQLVMRTGYGVFYQQAVGGSNHDGFKQFPFFVSQTFNASLPQPNISMSDPFPSALASSSLNPGSGAEHFRTGYVQHFNLGFQYEPWNDVLIDMAYMGSVSRKLPQSRNLNQPYLPSATGSVASRRPFQGFGNISFSDTVANANFNSFQLRVEKRYAAGLSLGGAYTFAKSIDTFNDGDGDSGVPDNYNYNGTMRGLATSDTRNRLVISNVYELPFGAGKKFLSEAKGFGGWFVSGWEVSGITTVQSGRPFTASITSDISNTGITNAARPILIGDPYLPKSERTVDRWFNTAAFAIPARGTYGNVGRNTMTGPGLTNFDLALLKNSNFGEKKSIQFRAEAFNLANHPNLHLPNRLVDTSSAGTIFAADFSRQIQLGLKFIF